MQISHEEAFYLIDQYWWQGYRPPVRKWLLLRNEEAIHMLLDQDVFTFGFFDEQRRWTLLVGIPTPSRFIPLPSSLVSQ